MSSDGASSSLHPQPAPEPVPDGPNEHKEHKHDIPNPPPPEHHLTDLRPDPFSFDCRIPDGFDSNIDLCWVAFLLSVVLYSATVLVTWHYGYPYFGGWKSFMAVLIPPAIVFFVRVAVYRHLTYRTIEVEDDNGRPVTRFSFLRGDFFGHDLRPIGSWNVPMIHPNRRLHYLHVIVTDIVESGLWIPSNFVNKKNWRPRELCVCWEAAMDAISKFGVTDKPVDPHKVSEYIRCLASTNIHSGFDVNAADDTAEWVTRYHLHTRAFYVHWEFSLMNLFTNFRLRRDRMVNLPDFLKPGLCLESSTREDM